MVGAQAWPPRLRRVYKGLTTLIHISGNTAFPTRSQEALDSEFMGALVRRHRTSE